MSSILHNRVLLLYIALISFTIYNKAIFLYIVLTFFIIYNKVLLLYNVFIVLIPFIIIDRVFFCAFAYIFFLDKALYFFKLFKFFSRFI